METKNQFNGVKVFSATMHQDREQLGERVTEWLRRHDALELVDVLVTQSSDDQFHCVAITVFYFDAAFAARVLPPPKTPTTTSRSPAKRLAFKAGVGILLALALAACGVDDVERDVAERACPFWNERAIEVARPMRCMIDWAPGWDAVDGDARIVDDLHAIAPVRLRREHGSTMLVPMVLVDAGDGCIVLDCIGEVTP